MKDEALSPVAFKIESFSIARPTDAQSDAAAVATDRLAQLTLQAQQSTATIHHWLEVEFGLSTIGRALEAPASLDADAFATAVRAALPKRQRLSAADIGRLMREHADTIEPARRAAAEAAVLERRLSDLVNAAYGLTPEDVRLMWETAPPRMPVMSAAFD